MNADGARRVVLEADVAAKVGWLLGVRIGLLVAGLLLMAGGIVLIVVATRRSSRGPVAPLHPRLPSRTPPRTPAVRGDLRPFAQCDESARRPGAREQHRIAEFGNTSALTPEASSALEPAPRPRRRAQQTARSEPPAAARTRHMLAALDLVAPVDGGVVAAAGAAVDAVLPRLLASRRVLARFEPVGTGATVEPRPGRRPVEAIIARTTVEHVDAGAAEQEIATAPARAGRRLCHPSARRPAPPFNPQPRICGWQLMTSSPASPDPP